MPEEKNELPPEQKELLNEVLRALRGMRFGSILLTVHDGRVVEVQRTERFRRNTNGPQE